MAEAVAGPRVGRFAPEQGGELVAGMGLAGADGEVGQQRLGLPARQAQDRAGIESGVKATEQRHRVHAEQLRSPRCTDYSLTRSRSIGHPVGDTP